MNSNRKSRISAAVTAAMVGLAGTAGTATAQAQGDPKVLRTGTGQVLIFPYYTVRDGWITTFNVTNTAASTLAVKVRLRESKNSRDVLDFNIVMSPYDVWNGLLTMAPYKDPDGNIHPDDMRTTLYTHDNSCTSPGKDIVNGGQANPFAYTGTQADGGGSGNGRAYDGYLEMLVMGESAADVGADHGGYAPDTVPYNAWHKEDGVPEDCDAVDDAFLATASQWDQQSDLTGQTGDPPARDDFVGPSLSPDTGSNPLKGNIAWLQTRNGIGAGSTALAVSDWTDANLVTAQEFPWFLEPTFVTNGAPWTLNLDALLAFESAIGVSTAFNEWAVNPATGAVTDWVITFPTKAYHVDKFNEEIQAAINKYRNGLTQVVTCPDGNDLDARGTCTDDGATTPLEPFTNLFAVEQDGVEPLGDSQVEVIYTFYNREELGEEHRTGETGLSPAPPAPIIEAALRYETNVIQFARDSLLGSRKAAVIPPEFMPVVGAVNGWGSLTFPTGGATGMPALGFAVKARTQGNPDKFYGQAMDHGYRCVKNDCSAEAAQ